MPDLFDSSWSNMWESDSAQRRPLLRRAIIIQAEGIILLEKHAIAPSAARLCYARRSVVLRALPRRRK